MESALKTYCAIVSLMFATGCASQHHQIGLAGVAAMDPEPHQIWTRPLEVGFEMGRYIEAETTQRALLGLVPVGEGGAKCSVPVFGNAGEMTPAVEYTVSQAVKEADADGMYILFVEERVQWNGAVKETTTFVKGRTLKLEDFGSVDQERATRVRVQEAGQREVAQ